MSRETVIANPYYIQVHLLRDCIFNCSYCYLRSCQKEDHLTVNQIKKLLKQVNDNFETYGLQTHINLTGGDIWLYPQIEKIFSLLSNSKAVANYSLLINSLWHETGKHLIKQYKDDITLIQLNIDALNNRQEDLTFLKELGARHVVKIMLSRNEPYYRRQLNTIKKLMAHDPTLNVSVDRLCPINDSQIEQQLSTAEVKTKIDELMQITKNIFIVDDPLLKALLEGTIKRTDDKILNNIWTGCAIPNGGLAVYPNGQIKLCARLPMIDTGFTIDNFVLNQYIETFSDIRRQQTKQCAGCDYLQTCQGGCPATSYINNKTFTKDNQCWQNE